jgi:hypothetical protein
VGHFHVTEIESILEKVLFWKIRKYLQYRCEEKIFIKSFTEIFPGNVKSWCEPMKPEDEYLERNRTRQCAMTLSVRILLQNQPCYDQ